MTLAQRFNNLFKGLDRAYGTYTASGEFDDRGKAKGKGTTIKGPVTEQLWQDHLDGKQRLGIVPVNDDGVAFFGAIDIDDYRLDIGLLEQRVMNLGLPLTICRSKSGGAHLYLFTDGVDAKIVRAKLEEWAIVLGFPGVEIFPKQSRLANKDDVGNWINIPYFDAELSTTHAICNGQPLDPDTFLTRAEDLRLTTARLQEITINLPTLPEGAPPCLQAMAINGVPEGNRNSALFGFGVLARLMFDGAPGWEDKLQEFNNEYMDPPLALSEVNGVIKSVDRKNYFYSCDNPPLSNFCNKAACKRCKYGIGGGSPDDPGVLIDGVVKILTDPPTWIFRIAGANVEMETDDFLSQQRFKRKVVEKLNRVPHSLKQPKWEELINTLLQTAEEVEAPEDASSRGQFLTHLRDFCNKQSRGKTIESLVTTGVYHDEDAGLIYFRSPYLLKYLEQQKFRDYNEKQVWSAIRKIPGSDHGGDSIKGRFINYWVVPAEDVNKEDFTVPTVEQEEF